MSYRTKKRAIVHPLNGAPLRPWCDLDYRNSSELKAQLTTYLRGFWPLPQKIVVDTAARKILVNGNECAAYELTEPAATKSAMAVMH